MSVCSSGVGFINSHSSRIRRVGLEYLDNTFLYVPFSLAVLKSIRRSGSLYILGVVVMLTCLHSKGTCHIAFSTACGSGDKDVAVICDIFTAGKSLYQFLIELSSRSVVYIHYTRGRLVKFSVLDEPFEPVALTVGIFVIVK